MIYPLVSIHCCCCLVIKLCLTLLLPYRLQSTRLLCPWDFAGKNNELGCHFLLQGLDQSWSLASRFFTSEPSGKPNNHNTNINNHYNTVIGISIWISVYPNFMISVVNLHNLWRERGECYPHLTNKNRDLERLCQSSQHTCRLKEWIRILVCLFVGIICLLL